MNSLELTAEQAAQGYRPLAGRVLLEIEAPDAMVGSIHVPETAQRKNVRDALQVARVLAIGYGPFKDGEEWLAGIEEGDVSVSDRVAFLALQQDLNKRVIMTAVTRIAAVLD